MKNVNNSTHIKINMYVYNADTNMNMHENIGTNTIRNLYMDVNTNKYI